MVNGRHCKLLWLSRRTVDALHVNGVLMVEMGGRRREIVGVMIHLVIPSF